MLIRFLQSCIFGGRDAGITNKPDSIRFVSQLLFTIAATTTPAESQILRKAVAAARYVRRMPNLSGVFHEDTRVEAEQSLLAYDLHLGRDNDASSSKNSKNRADQIRVIPRGTAIWTTTCALLPT